MNHHIEINDKIVIRIDMPECSPRELEGLKDASGKTSLHAFLDLLDWISASHQDEEWIQWEATSPRISLTDYTKFLERRNRELERMNSRLKEENRLIRAETEKKKNRPEAKWKRLRGDSPGNDCWRLESRIIVLEEENRKLKNRLSAYTSKIRKAHD